jgi:L-ascorbate metabolism protein UlaG (beta-lactamase superfamily)
MQIQSIRNATMRVEYHSRHFVCDPYLADKLTRPSYTGKSLNPLVDLPIPPNKVIEGAEFILLSHLHSDHFDPAAIDLVPRSTLLFTQPQDKNILEGKGFTQVVPINESIHWNGINISRIPGQHGSGAVLEEMGQASGFIFSAVDEPTVFWIGDTILTEPIRQQIIKTQPEIIITHSSGAVWGKERVLIVMDAVQTVEVCRLAPQSKVIAVHMEALDHGTISRKDLREYADSHGVKPDRLIIPADGETMQFNVSKNKIGL